MVREVYVMVVSILMGSLAACDARTFEVPSPHLLASVAKSYPQTIEKEVDILFVIDNSESMKEEHTKIIGKFRALIDALRSDKLDGRIPNVHIGVVTTDLGDRR